MELFIPSVLVLLLAAAVVFFVLPRFGAPVLAVVSLALLVYGIYQHMSAFGNEYRFSTWQLGLVSYAPYVMIGGLLFVIAFYLLTISPLGAFKATAPNMPEMPSISEMPSANTATNVVTEGVNNALKGLTNLVGQNKGNANKNTNAVNEAANTANKIAKNAAEAVSNTANAAKKGLANAVNSVTGLFNTNNPTKPNNSSNANKGTKIPGLNFTASQF